MSGSISDSQTWKKQTYVQRSKGQANSLLLGHRTSLSLQTDTSRQPSLNFDLPSANAETPWQCRAGSIALRLEGDIVFYALGTGEYDELNCKCEIIAVSAMRVC